MTEAPDPVHTFTGRYAFPANPSIVEFTHAETRWRSAAHAIEAASAATGAHAESSSGASDARTPTPLQQHAGYAHFGSRLRALADTPPSASAGQCSRPSSPS